MELLPAIVFPATVAILIVLFLIGVALSRWVFRINKIVKSLEEISEANWKTVKLLSMRIKKPAEKGDGK